MNNNIFAEISVLIAMCAAVAMIMRLLRQPLIIGYIITGLLVGPSLLGLVKSPDTIEVLGDFGVALLLFIVGLGLNPRVIKEVGKISLIASLGQIITTTSLVYFIGHLLGYNPVTSLYIGLGLAFSSTIIVLKLLNDKHEQNTLSGKVVVGILLVEDIAAALVLIIAGAANHGSVSYQTVMPLLIKGLALFFGTLFVSHFIIRRMTNFLASSQELLFLFALAWGFGVAAISYEVGFSVEIGALLAGAVLATMPYAQEVGSRLRPLRDFFIIIFFIALGTRLNVSDVQAVLGHALLFSAFVLLIKPLIIITIMGILGYTKRSSFKTGVALSQISEFSLILVLLAAKNGQISQSTVSLLMVIAVLTMGLSSYLIIYSETIYGFLERYLRLFERKKVRPEHNHPVLYDAVLFGFKKGGSEYAGVFKQLSKKFVVVDYDPEAIDDIERQNFHYIYGDATDLQMLEEINLEKVKIVVSVITDYPTNVFILQHLHTYNPSCVMICHADTVQQAIELYGLGASFVVLPHYIGNEKVSGFIKRNGFKKSEFNKYREKHLSYLQNHFEADNN